jgi:hypothetical protein
MSPIQEQRGEAELSLGYFSHRKTHISPPRRKLAFLSGPKEIKSSAAKQGWVFWYFQTEPHSRTSGSELRATSGYLLATFPTAKPIFLHRVESLLS